MVVEPNNRLGSYGGDWNNIHVGSDAVFTRGVSYEYLMRWNPGYTEVIPNVARDYEVSDDGTEVTFMLRAGMRWSDGEPFTSDDLLFAYNDVLSNRDLFPSHPALYVSGGDPGRLEKIDDHTVKFVFPSPHGLFIQLLATPQAIDLVCYPSHYLKKFHQEYNAEVDQLVEEEGQPDWVELFSFKASLWENPELPRIHPWIPTNTVADGDRVIFERNPYYWKVDPEGRQLPYLDRVIFHVVSDREVIVLMASSGELDMENLYVNQPRDRPVLAQNREAGGYDFFTQEQSTSADTCLAFNLTTDDPVKREIFQNKDFRIGISHAINRAEIVDVVYQRQGEPYQVAPRPDSPYYDENMAKQYTEYDPALAAEHLDRAGYEERDGDGMRLGSDGNRISVQVICRADNPVAISVLELIETYARDVGVEIRIDPVSAALFGEQRTANGHEAAIWQGEGGGGIEPPLRPDWWFPSDSESQNYARRWMEWYQSDGQAGEEPPEEVREQMVVYQEEVRATLDEDVRAEAMARVLQMSADYFYHIGISLKANSVGIVKNNFHNVPETMTDSWYYPTPGPTNPEQYFVD